MRCVVPSYDDIVISREAFPENAEGFNLNMNYIGDISEIYLFLLKSSSLYDSIEFPISAIQTPADPLKINGT